MNRVLGMTAPGGFKVGRVAKSLLRLGFYTEADVKRASKIISEKKGMKAEDVEKEVKAKVVKKKAAKTMRKARKAAVTALENMVGPNDDARITQICESVGKDTKLDVLIEKVKAKLKTKQIKKALGIMKKQAGMDSKKKLDETADVYIITEGKEIVACYRNVAEARAYLESCKMAVATGGKKKPKITALHMKGR